MKNQRKETLKEIEEKLKFLKLDLENIPSIFEISHKVKYKSLKGYDNSNYKVYHFVDVKNIEIYLTKAGRLEDANIKYKLAEPLASYLEPENEEQLENYTEFLKMLKELDIDKIEKIEQMQKDFKNEIPFEIRYKDNFIWEIYYSEEEDKYFMMFSTEEAQTEALFYLIKKQIELQKSKRTEMIYVPINNLDYSNSILKKSEIADLENYLWYFTGNWPFTYELQEKDKTKSIQIVGKVPVYEKIKSIYKLKFNSKEEAQKEFKLIKALFIIKSNSEEEYPFQIGINEKGSLNFYFNHNQITYEKLAEFIENEIQKKKEIIQNLTQENVVLKEKYILLNEAVQKENIEYLQKEKQIATFLEYKKTFFGKVSYFFKTRKKKNNKPQEIEKKEKQKIELEKVEIEEKSFYTVEDLLKVCNILEKQEKEYKNMQMDIKALENKKENLERKIKNATLYINEIESHKKSIFDFWKFTNKDEVSLLVEGESKQETQENHKIKKSFNYEEDIEEVGKKIDKKQRNLLEEKESDAIFAIYQDVEAFNIERKEAKLKKDEKYLEKSLQTKQEEYNKNFETVKEKDFDIFGSVVEDKTKIKVLNNQKHREIEKDKYKILDISANTTVDEYRDNIHHYQNILKEAYLKMKSPYDISVYKISEKPIEENKAWVIMDMNARKTIDKWNKKEDSIILNRINIKEDMNILFYSNIIFYQNLNKTLPEGMDISTEVLLDLQKYEMKLVGRKDFNINVEGKIKNIQVYEYDIEQKE